MSKFRKDFVTNSSSSSFICEVCGREESGWDMCLSEAGMFECENGHTFCEDEVTIPVNYKDFLQEVIEDNEELLKLDEIDEYELEDLAMDYDFRDETPIEYCPICSFQICKDNDIVKYLMKINNITKNEILEEIKNKFGTYEEFKKFIEDEE